MPFLIKLLCLITILAVLARTRRYRQGTTLVAPAYWTWGAGLILLAVETLIASTTLRDTTADALRYTAAMGTFCPLMAVLGAKRPQDRGWQFIVLTLWIVLVLPVAERMFLWQGGSLDEGPARRWFSLILLAVGVTNYVLTRYALAAVLITSGQACLLAGHLPLPLPPTLAQGPWGLLLIAAGTLSILAARPPHESTGWTRVWLDFRDQFGLVWSLRVMERVRATSALAHWTTTLTWYGFEPSPATGEADEIDRTLRTLLRRFVSEPWITSRREDTGHRDPEQTASGKAMRERPPESHA